MSQRGDTIVEVLLATVIVSAVMSAAYSLTNRATRLNQTSVERTTVANLMREQVELVRGARTASNSGPIWSDIMTKVNADVRVYNDSAPCEPTNDKSFYLTPPPNPSLVDYDSAYRLEDAHNGDIYAIWIEAYKPSTEDYVDFHVRACWEGIGGEAIQRSAIVLRLAI